MLSSTGIVCEQRLSETLHSVPSVVPGLCYPRSSIDSIMATPSTNTYSTKSIVIDSAYKRVPQKTPQEILHEVAQAL